MAGSDVSKASAGVTRGRLDKFAGPALGVAWLLLAYAWVMNAWIGDDAFITFRTAQNLAEGFGPRWNPGERVQTFTHPLWMLIVSLGFRITGEFYLTVLALSLGFTFAACRLLTRGLDLDRSTLVLSALVVSKAFIDYSSSGLENPLSYCLLAAFALSRTPIVRVGLAGALFLTRQDLILLVFPGLAMSLWQGRSSLRLRQVALPALPVAAWALFSVIYYGFFFPNTAYAKLGTGISSSELAVHGLWYFVNSLKWDAPTLTLLALAVLALARSLRRDAIASALGIVAYLLYVVWIGGDFMTGRFFAAPFFLAVATGIRVLSKAPPALLSLALALIVSAAMPLAPLKTTREYRGHLLGWDHGVTDERGLYWRKDTGLIFWGMRGPLPIHPNIDYARELKARGESVVVEGVVGILGWAAGRDLTIIDPLALGDPLLARLPLGPGDWWGVGHFPRRLPPGYEDSVRSGRNEIVDPSLRLYYQKLKLITSGPIFSVARWETILAMSLGRYDALVKAYTATLLEASSGPLPESPEKE